jgi:5-methylcytosine-specific restriction endonuclease McrA
MLRAKRCCENCGGRLPLELHHLRYYYQPDPRYPFTEPIDGHETPDDLAALCRDCHHGRHIDPNGDFWRDPEDMADAWFGFRWEMDKA